MSNPAARTHWPFALAMRDYFDNVSKTAAEFMLEIKALTEADRDYFKAELTRVGYAGLN